MIPPRRHATVHTDTENLPCTFPLPADNAFAESQHEIELPSELLRSAINKDRGFVTQKILRDDAISQKSCITKRGLRIPSPADKKIVHHMQHFMKNKLS